MNNFYVPINVRSEEVVDDSLTLPQLFLELQEAKNDLDTALSNAGKIPTMEDSKKKGFLETIRKMFQRWLRRLKGFIAYLRVRVLGANKEEELLLGRLLKEIKALPDGAEFGPITSSKSDGTVTTVFWNSKTITVGNDTYNNNDDLRMPKFELEGYSRLLKESEGILNKLSAELTKCIKGDNTVVADLSAARFTGRFSLPKAVVMVPDADTILVPTFMVNRPYQVTLDVVNKKTLISNTETIQKYLKSDFRSEVATFVKLLNLVTECTEESKEASDTLGETPERAKEIQKVLSIQMKICAVLVQSTMDTNDYFKALINVLTNYKNSAK